MTQFLALGPGVGYINIDDIQTLVPQRDGGATVTFRNGTELTISQEVFEAFMKQCPQGPFVSARHLHK